MLALRGLSVMLIAAAACASAWPAYVTAQQAASPSAAAEVRDATGRLISTASFSEATDQVLIHLTFPDPPALAGTHGIQIHDVGRCDPPDFASAGSIFNPLGKQHGLRNPAGPMVGDIPSLVIGPTGLAAYNTAAPLARLSPGPASLLRQGGTSLVIFAQPDDDQNQPEGNSGARIACGVIQSAVVSQARPSAPSGAPDVTTAALIAALGALLIAAGLILRRAPSRR